MQTSSHHSPSLPTKVRTESGSTQPLKTMHVNSVAAHVNGKLDRRMDSESTGQHRPGIQVIDEDQNFNETVSKYLASEEIERAGFNYHVVSVFGSQSTGKSTLLNHLFGTHFDIMSENERRQTTKGIWMSKNQMLETRSSSGSMAKNILVLDVEGTDGRERGEDQDFERKAALFALATSEVLIVNIWEHQVGLYQGANMGLLKVVFEVNLELFLKGKSREARQRSLLYFVIRDHLGTTPLSNLQNTLVTDLARIWAGLNKPSGMEHSKIGDYFDIAFAALPHKILQPEKFVEEVAKLGSRFRDGEKGKVTGLAGGVFLPEYHRRVPADGFSVYAHAVWEQIVSNKDLDLPTQQELLAQFRCDEIMRDALVEFDAVIVPFEQQQSSNLKTGLPALLGGLGSAMRSGRATAIEHFGEQASRYLKSVYNRKRGELESKLDVRLKALFLGQLSAAHKSGCTHFSETVSASVKGYQKKGGSYDFGSIVARAKEAALIQYEDQAKAVCVDGASWSDYSQELELFRREIDDATSRLRSDEMRRLATRVERWVRTRVGESVGLQFNQLGSGRGAIAAAEQDPQGSEKDIWDRIWDIFAKTVAEAGSKFSTRAEGFDASADELGVGLWKLRRKSWGLLKSRIEEELMDGNLLLKLRENFEDKFRYDEAGVPRIWRPTDDIEGAYTTARESTLALVPILARFELSRSSSPPPLLDWIGATPPPATSADDEDLVPIGGIDDNDGKTVNEEMVLITDAKRQEVITRFKKTADGVYVEAKRSAVGGITQVPLYFYGLLLALGWNEILAVLRNPLYFMMLIILAVSAYVTYTLNLWGPILKMANAASVQALEEFKKRLREFLETSETGRQAIAMSGDEYISLQRLRKPNSSPLVAEAETGAEEGDGI